MTLSFVGILLTGAKVDDGWIPINRSLWSLSFVFTTSGAAFLALIFFYLAIDCVNIWSGVPFSFVGKNSLLIYVGQEILKNYFPFSFITPYTFSSHGLVLASNFLGVFTWVIIAFILHKKGLYLRV